MSERFLMDVIFDGIANKMMSDLDEGLLDVSDEIICDFLAICLMNEYSGKFVGKLIEHEFKLEEGVVSDFLVDLYKTGVESLTAGR